MITLAGVGQGMIPLFGSAARLSMILMQNWLAVRSMMPWFRSLYQDWHPKISEGAAALYRISAPYLTMSLSSLSARANLAHRPPIAAISNHRFSTDLAATFPSLRILIEICPSFGLPMSKKATQSFHFR